MLSVDINEETGIVLLEPHGALTESDFIAAAQSIDPYIEEHGHLTGVIIHTEHFPGWESFGAFVSHIKFVKNHHHKLAKVALVTDAKIGDLAEKLGSHFISAEIKHYPFEDCNKARYWILSDPE